MYIDLIKAPSDLRYTHVAVDVPFLPDVSEDGWVTWKWNSIFDTGVDVHIALEAPSYVGAVTLPLAEQSAVRGVEVLAGGRVVGKYMAEKGKTASGRITVAVGVMSDALILRVYADMKDVSFTSPEIALCREDGVPFLWPVPKQATATGERVRIARIAAAGNAADEVAAAAFLAERVAERFGACLVADGVDVTMELAEEGYENERYTVSVTHEEIRITAGTRFMLMYAACKLLQLADDGAFCVGEIDDRPDKPLRGFHLYLPSTKDIEFTKRFFRYFLVPFGYNTLFVEFAGGMRFDRHPEITEAWLEGNARAKAGLQPPFPHGAVCDGEVLEKWQVRDLVDTATSYGIEVIPEVQSLGHVQYITYAHPEIAERVEEEASVAHTREEDARPNNFYAHCYCPSNELSYQIIFDIIDEIVEVVRPKRYVHIGHDEVYHLGLCNKCRSTPHHELFARHVNRLYDYLKSKGLGTIMWSDMIQKRTKYNTQEAIDLLPKDILCLDFIWYFQLDQDLEDNLLEKGYTVAVGNLYSSHYPRYRTRMLKQGMIGGQISAWSWMNEEAFARLGKLYDIMYTSQMLWNPTDYNDAMREVYAHLITTRLQPLVREEFHGSYYFGGYTATDLPLPEGDQALPACLLVYRPDAVVANGCEVAVNGCYDRLCIEHTALHRAPSIAWGKLFLSGVYTVSYEDGTCVEIPATYFGNVQQYNRRYAAPQPNHYYRHTGYVGTWFADPTLAEKYEGEDVLLTSFTWENPHPGKKIRTLSYRASEGDYTGVVLTGVKGLSKN